MAVVVVVVAVVVVDVVIVIVVVMTLVMSGQVHEGLRGAVIDVTVLLPSGQHHNTDQTDARKP